MGRDGVLQKKKKKNPYLFELRVTTEHLLDHYAHDLPLAPPPHYMVILSGMQMSEEDRRQHLNIVALPFVALKKSFVRFFRQPDKVLQLLAFKRDDGRRKCGVCSCAPRTAARAQEPDPGS